MGASVLLLGFGLLVWDLDGVALSGDEIGNVLIETGPLGHIFDSMATAWSQHPPVSHLVNGVGLRLFGGTDWGARAVSVLVSTVALALMLRFATVLLGRRNGFWSCLLLATAPTFVLYGRMEKYYAIVIALSLLLHIVLLAWLHKPRTRQMVAYGLLMAVLWYTDYLGAGFVAATHFAWLLLSPATKRRRLLGWGVAILASLVAFLPWLSVFFTQAGVVEAAATADLATGPVALVGKLAFFAYSYGIGETLFPWEVPALAGIVLVVALAVTALWQLRRGDAARRRVLLFLLTGFAIPSLGLTLLSLTPLLDTVPLITLPNHVIFALPLLRALLVGVGRWSRWRDWVLVLMIVLGAPAMVNLYEGRHYFNPAHVNPSREAVSYVVDSAQVGDIVVADEPDLFSYYLDRSGEHGVAFASANAPDAIEICAEGCDRLWLITIGRDRTIGSAPAELVSLIEGEMTLDHCAGFGEQDATYRGVKERLTGREAYLYRVVVCFYVDG